MLLKWGLTLPISQKDIHIATLPLSVLFRIHVCQVHSLPWELSGNTVPFMIHSLVGGRVVGNMTHRCRLPKPDLASGLQSDKITAIHI